jgi:hypothetical protein
LAKITVDTDVAVFYDGRILYKGGPYTLRDTYENYKKATADDFNDVVTVTEAFNNTAPSGIMANQADSVASDVPGLVANFNALLDKLKASGFMTPDA